MKACKQSLVFALLATAMAAPQLARGQATELAPPDDNFHRDRNMSVTERIQPGYEQVPLTLGSFDVLPSFTSGLAFDDNVFAEPVGKSDVSGIIRSDVNIQSNWSSNFLQATGFVEYDPYVTYGQEDAVPRGATIDGRYDISHGFYLSGLATYQNLVEPRTDSGAPTFTKSPVQYDETIFEGDISKTFNRVRLQLDAKRDAYAYDTAQTPAGAPVVLEYRNDAIYTITGRAEYAMTPATSVFVEAIGNNHVYNTQNGDPSNFNRNSHGWEVTGGVSADLAALATGELSLGYLSQSFKDPRLPTQGGLGVRAKLEFFPTGLTNVTLQAARTYEDSPIASSPLYLSSTVSLRLDHELLRNLLLFGQIGYEQDNYINLARTDKRPEVGLGATYMMNRWLVWKLGYSRLHSTSVGADLGPGFTDNRVSLTLTARL